MAELDQPLSDISSRAVDEKKALGLQRRQAPTLEAVGHLVGGIAHDFNNLLMVIQTSAFFLKESLDADELRTKDVVEIMNASERATGLVRQLMTFIREEVSQPKMSEENKQESGRNA